MGSNPTAGTNFLVDFRLRIGYSETMIGDAIMNKSYILNRLEEIIVALNEGNSLEASIASAELLGYVEASVEEEARVEPWEDRMGGQFTREELAEAERNNW